MEKYTFLDNELYLKVACPLEIIHVLIEELSEMEYFVFILVKHIELKNIYMSDKQLSSYLNIETVSLKKIIRFLSKEKN